MRRLLRSTRGMLLMPLWWVAAAAATAFGFGYMFGSMA